MMAAAQRRTYGDNDAEPVEPEVEEASLAAKLATDLQEGRPARRVQLSVPRGAVGSQSVLVDPVAQFAGKLEQMRLSVLSEEAAGSNVVLRRHGGVDLGETMERISSVVC